jgi:hypothetical protein
VSSLIEIYMVIWGLLLAGTLTMGPIDCQQMHAATVGQLVDNAEQMAEYNLPKVD